MAAKLYLTIYGLSRKRDCNKLRSDAGSKRKRDGEDASEMPSTEIGHRRARGRRVQEGAEKHAKLPLSAFLGTGIDESNSDVATFETAPEMKFLKTNINDKLRREARRKIKRGACQLLPADMDTSVVLNESAESISKADKKLMNDFQKRRQGLRGRQRKSNNLKKLKENARKFFFPASTDAKKADVQKFCPTATFVDGPGQSDVIITRTLEGHQTMKLICGLMGKVLMTWQCCQTGGTKEACMQYKKFNKMHKRAFVSASVCANPGLDHVVRALKVAESQAGSKTKLLDNTNKDAIITHAKARVEKGHGAEYIFLVSKAEKTEFSGLKNVCN